MDHRTAKALAIGLIWLIVVVIVRWALRRAYDHYEARIADRSPDQIARRRTMFSLLQRLVVAVIALLGALERPLDLSGHDGARQGDAGLERRPRPARGPRAQHAALEPRLRPARRVQPATAARRPGDDRPADGLRRGDVAPLHDAPHRRRPAGVRAQQPADRRPDRQPDDPRSASRRIGHAPGAARRTAGGRDRAARGRRPERARDDRRAACARQGRVRLDHLAHRDRVHPARCGRRRDRERASCDRPAQAPRRRAAPLQRRRVARGRPSVTRSWLFAATWRAGAAPC